MISSILWGNSNCPITRERDGRDGDLMNLKKGWRKEWIFIIILGRDFLERESEGFTGRDDEKEVCLSDMYISGLQKEKLGLKPA